MPAFDIEVVLVYSARGGDVRNSIIDGQLVMRDRKIQTLDEAALMEDVQQAVVHVVPKAGIEPTASMVLATE
jgi:5-methylthioadenosine/S-adenosylhomocysteine deaminase